MHVFRRPKSVDIPCIFPINREYINGDEIARDCNHRQINKKTGLAPVLLFMVSRLKFEPSIIDNPVSTKSPGAILNSRRQARRASYRDVVCSPSLSAKQSGGPYRAHG